MRITDFLGKETIELELKAEGKPEVIKEMVGFLARAGKVSNQDEAVKVLMEREKLGSTGIGQGIAIPHAKMKRLADIIIAFGRSKTGVEFDSLDGEPAYLIFLVLSPVDSTENLKVLAKISRLLKDKFFRQALKKAKDSAEIFKLIKEEEEE